MLGAFAQFQQEPKIKKCAGYEIWTTAHFCLRHFSDLPLPLTNVGYQGKNEK